MLRSSQSESLGCATQLWLRSGHMQVKARADQGAHDSVGHMSFWFEHVLVLAVLILALLVDLVVLHGGAVGGSQLGTQKDQEQEI